MEIVTTTRSARPVGPYSQAVIANGFVFVSGLPPLDPETGKVVQGDIQVQTRRCMDSLKAILEEAGVGMQNVVQVMVYLMDMTDFAAMNEVYASYFPDGLPARTTPQIIRLPKEGAKIGVDAIAAIPNWRP